MSGRVGTATCARLIVWLLPWAFWSLGSATYAQTVSSESVAVHVDCKGLACDYDFIRTEITFADHVRERQDADVHVLITAQATGAGGREVTLAFIGQRDFSGTDDVIRYVTLPGDTEDERRRRLTNALQRGLVRYANRTSVAERITILYTPATGRAAAAVRDRWNHWTFTTAVNGFVSGEELVGTASLGASASANRTTGDWLISASASTDYSRTSFEIGRGQDVISVQRNHAGTALIAFSVDDHMSIGGRSSVTSSTFLNQSLTFRVAPAIEYNLFPYRESTRRMLTFEYSIGMSALDYEEETIFGVLSENLLDHRVLAILSLTQPWGSVELGAEGSHYLHDIRKNRGIALARVDWNVTRGLSLFNMANFQRIRDQLFLSARGASEEEILLRQRQLATSYSYSVSLGVSYRFGSSSANVVNRRFAGSVGGMVLVH
jgi:hypothetical protein